MSRLPHNYQKYPQNVMEPKKIEIDGDVFNVFGYHFKGLRDFYDFLKSNPKINYTVWNSDDKIASISNNYSFAGCRYEEAVEKLVQEMDPGYQEYLRIQKSIKAKMGYSHRYRPIKTVAGGVVDPVSYITGSPTIYRASRLVKQPRFVTLDTQIAYYHGTSKKQVFHRALIITNLVHALEKAGYSVNVNSFMAVEEENELINAIFEIKNHGQKMNYQTLYKSLVDVEFFRRLCFRLMEISDVKNEWYYGYGQTCSKKRVRQLLHLNKEDLYFDQPRNMEIRGSDIGSDFERVVEELGLDDVIDVEREKEVLRQSIKVLKKD